MKKVIIASVIVIILLGGFIVLTLFNLGPLVKKAVNMIGPKITKTNVKVEDVKVSVFSGEARIKNFSLGNPKGFKSLEAISIGYVYVDIVEDSITKDPIVIRKIEIIAPDITYEKIQESDNFKVLLNNVKDSVKSYDKTEKKDLDKKEKKMDKKIIIKDILIKQGRVNLIVQALKNQIIKAPLPDIHLKGIGVDENGVSAAKAFEQIIASIYKGINAESVTNFFNQGLKKLEVFKEIDREKLEQGKKTITKKIDSAVKKVEDKIKDVTKELDVDSLTKGLKSLFEKS